MKYVVTVVIVAVATLLQWLIYPYSGNAPFVLYYPTVILGALYGDGIAAIVLSSFLAQFLFVNKPGDFSFIWPDDFIRQGLFIAASLMIRELTVRLSRALLNAEKEKIRAQTAEKWYSTTLNSIGDAVISTDLAGCVTFMNPIAENLTEWTLADARGQPLTTVFKIINQHTRLPVENPVEKVIELGAIVGLANHTVLLGKNGSEFAIEDSAAPIRVSDTGNIEGVILVFRDITEKYSQQEKLDQAAAEVSENESRIRNVIDNALDAVIAMDVNGHILQWNTQAEKIFGFSSIEVIGRKLSEVIIPRQHRMAHDMGMKRFLSTGHGPVLNKRIEITALNRNEIEFPVELSITPIRSAGILVFYGFIRDISERKRNEKTLLEAIQSRDEFLSIASHELKTPLTTLKLQSQLRLRKFLKDDTGAFTKDKIKTMIEGDMRQIDRLSRLIDDMLDISRISTGKFTIHKEQMELCAVLKDLFERFKDQMEAAGCSSEFENCEEIWGNWDRVRVEQIFMNLLTNAIKYGEGNPIHVKVVKNNTWAELIVRDEGIGIADSDKLRIFDRFERAISASEVSGLGLGLYIVKQIIEMHEGQITVESELGKGTTFTVRLPI